MISRSLDQDLLGVTGAVLDQADQLYKTVADLYHANDKESLESEGNRVREMIDDFSDSASKLFR